MRALISVFNKDGIEELVIGLNRLGVEIISTGGTANKLKQMGIPVVEVSSVTKFPEILDGRVKTLNPYIHGGLLAERENPQHMKTIKELNIQLIDIVVINLYPFEETIANPEASWAEIIEKIDIGGPAMIRSAAKNYKDVLVVVNPDKYKGILEALTNNKIEMSLREELAFEAFNHTAYYDSVISNYLRTKFCSKSFMPAEMSIGLKKKHDLRYGENPQQKAAFYTTGLPEDALKIEILQGKELSFNNYLDMNAAYSIVRDFEPPTVAIIKHTNPCGVALADDINTAFKKAYDADQASAYGSIIGLNRECDEETAEQIAKIFVEVVIAPSYSQKALKVLSSRKNLRVIVKPDFYKTDIQFDLRKITGGVLVQEQDLVSVLEKDLKCVTVNKPTEMQITDMLIGWKVIKYVKSNAIIIVKNKVMIGIGAGQMSRVEAVELAIKKAKDETAGAVLVSDAYLPFSDNVEMSAKAGISAIIQPGGSVRDAECIKSANESNISMVFTGIRHFRH